MSISLEYVSQFMYEHFQRVTSSKGGTHFLARCALCGDSVKNPSKKRFNMDWNDGQPIYHCFNCDQSGSFLTLYSRIKGISINEAKKELYSFNPDYLIQTLSPKKAEKVVKEVEYEDHSYILDDCVFVTQEPEGFLERQHYFKLLKFIENRKIPANIPIYMAYRGDYAGRIIIPIINDGIITYFQGRSLEDDPASKYKNPTLVKGNIILNKDNFDRSKHIIVTEGLIDAFQIGTQGTSCLGASVSEDFLKALIGLTDKGVIMALDNDKTGIKETVRLLKNSQYAHMLSYFLLIGHKYSYVKDLGELVQKAEIDDVYNFIVSNSYTKFDALIKLTMGGFVKDETNRNRKGVRGPK